MISPPNCVMAAAILQNQAFVLQNKTFVRQNEVKSV